MNNLKTGLSQIDLYMAIIDLDSEYFMAYNTKYETWVGCSKKIDEWNFNKSEIWEGGLTFYSKVKPCTFNTYVSATIKQHHKS